MSPRQGKTYPREPGRHLVSWTEQIIGYGPEFHPGERTIQDRYFDADVMRAKLQPTEGEQRAVEVAARYVGTTVSTLEVLCATLYGAEPDDLTPRQSRRTDGLLRLAWYVAREAGYEAAWRENPPGKSAGARLPADPPEQMEAA